MKQKTFDLLLDCYIKERLPDSEDIFEDDILSHTISLGPVSRAQAFCYSPTSRLVTDGCRSFNQVPVAQGFCYSPTAVVEADGPRSSYQNIIVEAGVIQGSTASVDVIDSPDIGQIQRCREVAQNLARIADSFEKGYTTSSDGGNARLSPDEYADGFTPEERHVLERIFSQGPSNISRTASVLADYCTSQTLQTTIRYLTEQNSDISQQLAIALELSTGLINIMGGKILGTVRDVVGGMFRNRAELEDL